jgi:hypothetical protein
MTETLNDAATNPQQTIAELQRKLAERAAERDELVQQQTATADVLKAMSSSAFDLSAVFDTVVESSAKLCNFDCPNAPDTARMREQLLPILGSDTSDLRPLDEQPTFRPSCQVLACASSPPAPPSIGGRSRRRPQKIRRRARNIVSRRRLFTEPLKSSASTS